MHKPVNIITIKILEGYSEAIETARRIGYDSHQPLTNYKEKYDDASWHVAAFIKQKIIGTIRITPPTFAHSRLDK